MNYRDLQNISNLSQEILIEGANEEHNVLNRWPYTSPYLQDDIMEKENSEYEKASDAALDARYGYGRASGDKRSFGRAANRSSAAAALRSIRRGERSGSGTSREAGADAVHQGWATTAKTSADQTPEKKERRAKLANTSYSNLPDDEKEKDRVSFDAVRATYNRNKTQKEGYDLYDIILSHLLDEGYAETLEQAQVIMTNMSEEWRESIVEGVVGEFADKVASTAGSVVGTAQRAVKNVGQKMRNVAGTYEYARQKASNNSPMTAGTKPPAAPGPVTPAAKPNSNVSSPGYDTRRIGGYDLSRLPMVNKTGGMKNPGPNFGRG